ncbi:hypothetical protein ACFQZ4_50885 [Catellatospora coxensis]|uniref:Uncharacterized protein n=1 Tax=Catellatospora coxensis TaxID=310354 RepID=A0A8J3KTX2_9ACTN|nr:hypothetical protein [Catellatospora coxensis]GIG05039.1 hypothetical protein Cco03nite_17390 [Catellatospora coxensis]
MSEQRQAPAEHREPADAVETPLPAEELRRRQQLGQTPGMFVEPTPSQALDQDADDSADRDEAA